MSYVWVSTVCLFFIMWPTVNTKKMHILVFGGNGFIGSECVNSLMMDDLTITVLNRGSNYYDYDTRIKPYVNVIECDRYQGLRNCEKLQKQSLKYDFVIDFSAYEPQVINDAILNLNIGTYIFISSDSVYEVSKEGHKKSKESDAKRPDTIAEQEIVNKKDEYGHLKLLGEELLITKSINNNFNFVILRLSDVFGPRDTTYRWWILQSLLQFPEISICLPKMFQNLSTSYVYVKDVAKLIRAIVKDIGTDQSKTKNKIYNFAYTASVNVRTLLNSMQAALRIQGVEYNYCENGIHLYPSVLRGPIDVTKIESYSLYDMTPWDQAIEETVNFFDNAFCKFPKERTTLMKKMGFLFNEVDYSKFKLKLLNHVSKNCKIMTEKDIHNEL